MPESSEFEVPREIPPDLWSKRPWSVEGHLGLGTPVGALGIMVEYLVAPAASVGGGVGFGSGPGDGASLHAAVVGRVRPVRGAQSAMVLGVALSTGGYRRFDAGLSEEGGGGITAKWAHFFQAEIGWERRAKQGFLFRMSLGFAAMLNPGDLGCGTALYGNTSTSCNPYPSGQKTEIIPTADITLGHSF